LEAVKKDKPSKKLEMKPTIQSSCSKSFIAGLKRCTTKMLIVLHGTQYRPGKVPFSRSSFHLSTCTKETFNVNYIFISHILGLSSASTKDPCSVLFKVDWSLTGCQTLHMFA
jgi:hypothetical protein